jgi:superfamily II DNA or RNA helicase
MRRRRLFNSGERVALYLASDGNCARCGTELIKGWHADHERHFALGGATDVVNGQALCPDCNLEKGMVMQNDLFQWQADTIELFISKMKTDFLCEATPAAGKTRVAAEIALRLLTAKIGEYVVVVVPTTRLRKQWAKAVRLATGLQLKYDWKPGDGAFPDADFRGIVVTYQTVANNAALFRRFCSKVPTIAILDEIHHASDKQAWGPALFDAFEPAIHRILLSGTPFRSDAGQIPFIEYVDGKAIADKSYGYGAALTDQIVREVFFPKIGGRMEWIDDDGSQSKTFDDVLDEQGQSRRLRTALQVDHPDGVLPTMLRQAHRELMEMRETDPDAAALFLAMDQEHARDAATLIKQILGADPIVVISDSEDDPNEAIETFISGDAPWIVAVRMISEGVDIPRLRVCVYGSNIVTDLFFRQVVGRVIRREPESEQPWAHVYIPDDPRLRQYAQEIRNQRDLVLGKEPDELGGPGGSGTPSMWTPISSTAEHAGAVGGEQFFTAAELAHARKIKLSHINTSDLSDVKVAILIRNAGGVPPAASASQAAPEDKTAQLKRIKAANESTSRQIAFRYGLENKEVNQTLNRFAGIASVTRCFDDKKLLTRLQIAKRWLLTGSPVVEGQGTAANG